MIDALEYIINKWSIDINQEMPVHLADIDRVALAKLFAELGYKTGAEIGTARGSYAVTLSINIPRLKLYCVDAWSTYAGLNDYTDQNQLDEYLAHAMKRFEPYKGIEIVYSLSMEAVKNFADASLDFVYIDANHEFPYVAEDLFYWSKKVRSGGIVSGHDYLKVKRKDGMVQVKEVVHAYTEAFNIKPWFVVDKCTLKNAGSFFWVKP